MPKEKMPSHKESVHDGALESDSDRDSDLAFVNVDFGGVDFDTVVEDDDAKDKGSSFNVTNQDCLDDTSHRLIEFEASIAFNDIDVTSSENSIDIPEHLITMFQQLQAGDYATMLRTSTFLNHLTVTNDATSATALIQQQVCQRVQCLADCIEFELLAIAALNLFLQGNYTGPSVEDIGMSDDSDIPLADINPHPVFTDILKVNTQTVGALSVTFEEEKEDMTSTVTSASQSLTRKWHKPYQNSVLAELSVDGDWPCQVCHGPYFLLLSNAILECLSGVRRCSSERVFVESCGLLQGVHVWMLRATVAHERMLQVREPSVTLWEQAQRSMETCTRLFSAVPPLVVSSTPNERAAAINLEIGLAHHHFDRPGKGRSFFLKAQEYSCLNVEVTGASGKRTKFQQKATAQMLVKATGSSNDTDATPVAAMQETEVHIDSNKSHVKDQLIDHPEDGILLERIKFDDEKENEIKSISVLDQAIILALCLDVKNSNPSDGLTAEEMGAYLACVLNHHDDWMIYSTALLERSWLEFERSHARERAILQMQALSDQHTNRLTFTQSTQKSIEESSPVQDRLKHLHTIVYPTRWEMLQDLADRYAGLGIVTSAAELYTEIEFWDDVVECYRRAGRLSKAEEIVRERLAVSETPRMWSALGDITNDPVHYQRAIELSTGRFSKAYVALGHFYYPENLDLSLENYEKSLKIRPLAPSIWFRVGTISMQLELWDKALKAFSEVVQQEPEGADAWANVAAVHLHNKCPSEAYPALVESLKHNRDNWRVWVSKLYTCLDLHKYDEAIQACDMLLELRKQRGASDKVPALEERCVRAIVGGSIQTFNENTSDKVALDSARRTLTRVHDLLEQIASAQAEPWVFETIAFLHSQVSNDDDVVLENLMKEYRSLQAYKGWEKDDNQIKKVCRVAAHICQIYLRKGKKESLVEARFLLSGVLKTIRVSRPDDARLPSDVDRLNKSLNEVKDMIMRLK
jgi:tetratricopeptide (TPR) repeat protein